MHFSLVTLFPEFFTSPLQCGLMGKACEEEVVSFSTVNPRDFTDDRHRSVDDRPYGGGPGMVMMCDPLRRALQSIPRRGRTLLLSPKGRPFDQALARELATEDALTLVCGRYEGIDARIEALEPMEPVSVGDYVLNGGEAGALCVIEAVARLLPRFMGKTDSATEESFAAGLLEYPHYTRPETYDGVRVPEVLLSGDHGRIARWRREQALRTTLLHRPELLRRAALAPQDRGFLQQVQTVSRGRNVFIALLHAPVLTRDGKVGTTSLTNLDIHDIGRVSCAYGLGGYYIVTPLVDQQELAQRLLAYWREGQGGALNPDRAQALEAAHVASDLDEVREAIVQRTGQTPLTLATSAQGQETMDFEAVTEDLRDRPVLIVFGTGSGLAPEIVAQADGLLPPLRFLSAYNHLSVRSAAAIIIDRIVQDWY
ncbi:MAG: tRNA (guanosine(37)-N1)-methyltransferase TrmD [Thermodesulfobacteriota bacterium]